MYQITMLIARTVIRAIPVMTVMLLMGATSSVANEAPSSGFPAEFVLDTLARHPAFSAANSDLEATRAEARSLSRPIYNPELSAGFEQAGEDTVEIGISQTIDWSGQRSARTALGEANLAAAQSEFEMDQRQLTAEIITALIDFETRRDLQSLAQNRQALTAEFLSVAQQRQNIGDVSPSALLSARLAHAEALADLSLIEADLSRAQETLAVLWGEARIDWPSLPRAPGGTEVFTRPPSYEALPELRLARAQIDITEAQIRVARADRRPNPTIGVRGGTEGDSDLLGIEISVPLHIRNTYSAELDAAMAIRASADQSYSIALRRANASLTNTNARSRSALLSWQAWNESGAGSLEDQRTLLARLWAAREIGVVEYIVQLDQTFDAQEAGISLRAQTWLSWVEWLVSSNQISVWVESQQ